MRRGRGGADQGVICAALDRALLYPQAGGGVGLGVKIDNENPLAKLSQVRA
jgi:hypothetical protein